MDNIDAYFFGVENIVADIEGVLEMCYITCSATEHRDGEICQQYRTYQLLCRNTFRKIRENHYSIRHNKLDQY